MKITLKDGTVKEYESKMSVLDIAKDISEGLARAATSAKVNGEIADLRTEVMGTKVNISTKGNGKGKIEIEYYSDKELERMFDMIMSLRREV